MRRFLGGLLVLMCAVPVQAQEGRLQRVRDALDRPDDDKPSKEGKSSKDSSSSSSNGDDGDGDSLLGGLVFYAALAPFALPHMALRDDLGRPGYFSRFPYSDNRPGYLSFNNSEHDESASLSTFTFRLSADYGNDFHGIQRFGTRLLLDTTSRFGLEASNDYFRERFSCGCTDELDLSAVNLTYRFAQNSQVLMYGGVGLNVLDDGWRTHYGVNFLYGADIFPVKPFVASLSVEAGTVEDCGLFRARGTIGVNWRRFEGFIGYDYLNIGGVDLQGPLAGFRFWY